MNSSIFIADDHPLLLKGLENFLLEKNYNVIGKARNGRSALNFIIKNRPHIAILDIEIPNLTGFEIVEECMRRRIETKFVLNTFHKEIKYYLKAKRLGVSGYLLKDFTLDEIEQCIESIEQGASYYNKEIQSSLTLTTETYFIFNTFNALDLKILKLIACYKTNKEIAEILLISCRTIEKHRSNMIQKLKLPKKTGTLLIWVHQNKHLFVI